MLALDFDPVMLELKRRTLGHRVHWVEAGFAEVATLAQTADRRLLVDIR
jgi:hypothetical protein